MPEELGIALIVLVFIGWVLVSIFSTLSETLTTTVKKLDGFFAQMQAQRFDQRKAMLSERIRVVLPDDLPRAERILNRLQTDFERRRTETIWTPLRPTWEKKPFLRQLFSPQSANWKDMDIAEIDFMLRPDPVMWSEKESALLAQTGIYPSNPPR